MGTAFAVSTTQRPKVYTGLLADLLTWGKVFAVGDFIVPSDAPGIIYRGDGVNLFADLPAMGLVKKPNAKSIATTGAGTSAAVLAGIKAGLITSTSAAAVTLTLPTAVILAAALGASRGVSIEFTVDNSAGANAVTVAVAAGITVGTAVITGSDSLAVASGKVGVFKIYFISATAAYLSRLL